MMSAVSSLAAAVAARSLSLLDGMLLKARGCFRFSCHVSQRLLVRERCIGVGPQYRHVDAQICTSSQVLKKRLTKLPLGGAKGGADLNPKGKTDNEVCPLIRAR